MASTFPTIRQLQLERVSYPALDESCTLARDVRDQLLLEDKDHIPIMLTEQSYRFQTILGEGTFGTVTLARQKTTGGLVAIKTLKKCEHVNPLDLREVQFFQNMTPHPSLVHMSQMYVDSLTRQVNFVLEVMDFNMLDLIHARRGSPIGSSVIASLSTQLLQGISHMHAHEFVHRDIKPENLLLSYVDSPKQGGKTLVVKIADFGLSRRVCGYEVDATWSGYVATRWYRAPEQLLQAPNHGYSLDIWAFGVVLSELCNLRPLFPGKDLYEMLNLQLRTLGSPSDTNFGGSWHYTPGTSTERYLSMLTQREISAKAAVVTNPHLSFFDKVVKSCLRWDPRNRATPEQLLYYLNAQRINTDKTATSVPCVPSQHLTVHGRSHSIG